jgi:uncharacterized protein YdhG (YjbR/CyaY superfamily)
MPAKRPTTVAEYVRAAPRDAQPHLRRLRSILKNVAPKAKETLKWGTPFFVEPRFLFAYSAHKAHLSFAPNPKALTVFRKQLEDCRTTRNMVQLPYDQPFPDELVRTIAKYCVGELSRRESDSFW